MSVTEGASGSNQSPEKVPPSISRFLVEKKRNIMDTRLPNSPIDILLVEDNPGDARLIQEALAGGTFSRSLNIVIDGDEALDLLRREGRYANASVPDLILLDLNLPKRNGLEVLTQIKADEDLKWIPIIIFTSSDAPSDIRESYMLHANCYITQPDGFDQFMKVVKSIEDFWLNTVQLPTVPDVQDAA